MIEPEREKLTADHRNRAIVEALQADLRRLAAELSPQDEPAVTYRLTPPARDDDR